MNGTDFIVVRLKIQLSEYEDNANYYNIFIVASYITTTMILSSYL